MQRKRKDRRAGFRVRRLVLLVILTVGASLAVLQWSWIDAQARAAVVLSWVLEAPALTPVVEDLTGEPVVEDREVAGSPTLVARPPGQGPWPAIVFLNGAIPPGRDEPTVRRLAQGLARAGYAVYVPDVFGLRSGEISGRTVSSTVAVARAASESPDTREGEVGLVGVSVGASLALLAAQDPALGDRVSVVAGVAPFAELETVLRLATTGGYKEDGRFVRYETPNYLRLLSARSLVASLPPGEARERLLRLIPKVPYYYPPQDESDDPLAAIPAFRVVFGEDLGPGARGVVDLLANDDPGRFDGLYAALDDRTRARVESLSPLTGARRLDAPVEIATAPRDRYFPVSEQEKLERASPRVRVTVTPALNHAEPAPSLGDLPAFLELNGFVVRSLREARLED